MRLACVLNRHRWGKDLYLVDARTADFSGEVALAFCRDCNAAKYHHVSMSRSLGNR